MRFLNKYDAYNDGHRPPLLGVDLVRVPNSLTSLRADKVVFAEIKYIYTLGNSRDCLTI